MVRMFARHTVTDYAKWREAYDAFDRGSMGVQASAVYRSADDPNDVTVWHDFGSLEDARSFVGSEELKATMIKAGVVSAPDIWITSET
jgi:hypothetical protein